MTLIGSAGSRAALFAVFVALLPEQCEKKPAPIVPPDPPPPVPTTSQTAPPIWNPPDPPETGAKVEPTDVSKARAALESKDYKKVRTVLEKKVKAGKGSPEEAQILLEACVSLKDKACAEAARKSLPP